MKHVGAETDDLVGISVSGMDLEPRGCSPEWTVAGEVWDGRQVTALNIQRLLHPTRIIIDVLSQLRPTACEMPCLGLPCCHCRYLATCTKRRFLLSRLRRLFRGQRLGRILRAALRLEFLINAVQQFLCLAVFVILRILWAGFHAASLTEGAFERKRLLLRGSV